MKDTSVRIYSSWCDDMTRENVFASYILSYIFSIHTYYIIIFRHIQYNNNYREYAHTRTTGVREKIDENIAI